MSRVLGEGEKLYKRRSYRGVKWEEGVETDRKQGGRTGGRRERPESRWAVKHDRPLFHIPSTHAVHGGKVLGSQLAEPKGPHVTISKQNYYKQFLAILPNSSGRRMLTPFSLIQWEGSSTRWAVNTVMWYGRSAKLVGKRMIIMNSVLLSNIHYLSNSLTL